MSSYPMYNNGSAAPMHAVYYQEERQSWAQIPVQQHYPQALQQQYSQPPQQHYPQPPQQYYHQPMQQTYMPAQYPNGFAAGNGMAGSSAYDDYAYPPGGSMAHGNLQGDNVYAPGGNSYGGYMDGQSQMHYDVHAPLPYMQAKDVPQYQRMQIPTRAAPSQQQPQHYGPVYHHGHFGHFAPSHNAPWGSTAVGPSHQPPQQYSQLDPQISAASGPQQQNGQTQARNDETEAPVAPLVLDLTSSTPPPPPPPPPTPIAPSDTAKVCHPVIKERISYMEKHILPFRPDHPVACTLLESWRDLLTPKQKQRYCSEYWPSNEAALANLHEMAKLSLKFSTVYHHMLIYETEMKAAREIEDEAEKSTAIATAESDHAARTLELQAKLKLEVRLVNLVADDKNLVSTLGKIRGKKQGEKKKQQREQISAMSANRKVEISELRKRIDMTIAERAQLDADALQAREATASKLSEAAQQAKAQRQARLEREKREKEEKKTAAKAEKAAQKAAGEIAAKAKQERDKVQRLQQMEARVADIQARETTTAVLKLKTAGKPRAKAQLKARKKPTPRTTVNKKRKGGGDDQVEAVSPKRRITAPLKLPVIAEDDLLAAFLADTDDEDSEPDRESSPIPAEDDLLAAFFADTDDEDSDAPSASPLQDAAPLPQGPTSGEVEQPGSGLSGSPAPQDESDDDDSLFDDSDSDSDSDRDGDKDEDGDNNSFLGAN
ncbi:hypothetical protein J1614_008825 [Plenodomus biglobosus]|nr:hypothetical protein J1614_008825 [Plenodomus biglobosus]